MTAHRPEALHSPPEIDLSRCVQAARQRRLVLYLGAGLSAAWPSNGPTGWQVADRLRAPVASMLQCAEADLEAKSLEDLAQLVADKVPEKLTELKRRASECFEFAGIEPNYGHEATALLLREGLVQVITTNWDTAIEAAGLRNDTIIESVATAQDRLTISTFSAPVYKVHGCCQKPATLALTQNEVDSPQTWARAQVQSAITAGVVTFVGLGTVGMYVKEPLKEIIEWARSASTVLVVAPTLSPQWRDTLGTEVSTHHANMTASAFLDSLLRSVVNEALADVERDVISLLDHETFATKMKQGYVKFNAAAQSSGAVELLRWWRDGAVRTLTGKPFITEVPGRKSLMTVMLLAATNDLPLRMEGQGAALTVATEETYFEIVYRPGEHVRRAIAVAESRVHRRRQECVYRDSREVVVVIADAFGQLPAATAPLDIAAEDSDVNDIAVIRPNPIRVVAAEDGIRGLVA